MIFLSKDKKKFKLFYKSHTKPNNKNDIYNHLGGGPVVRAWDQEVCSLCSFRFEPCGYSYDGH
jgi:hypothetical protein